MTQEPPPPPPATPPPPGPPRAAAVREQAPATDPRWPVLPEGWWRGTAPHATFPVPFSALEGTLLASWSFLGQLVIGGAIGLALALVGYDLLAAEPFVVIVFSAIIFVLVLVTALAYLRLRGRLTWRLWGPVRPAWSHLLWGLVAGVVGVFVIQLGVGLILTLLGETDPPQQSIVEDLGTGGATTVGIVILAVVLAPLVEEILFRGIWFQSLRRVIGLWPAAVISSLGFGVVHFEVIEVAALPAVVVAVVALVVAVIPTVPLVVRVLVGAVGLAALAFAVSLGGFASVLLPGALASLGFLFCVAFHRTGSLVVPIVGHAVFNGIVVALALVAESFEGAL